MVYMTMQNPLLEEQFIIVCTHKKRDDAGGFLTRIDGTRIRFAVHSERAARYTYKEARRMYETLSEKSKSYRFTVSFAPKKDIHFRNYWEYVKAGQLPRAVETETNIRAIRART